MADSLDMLRELQQIPLFTGLGGSDVRCLRRLVQSVEVSKGNLLYRQGDHPHHLFVLLRGRVKVIRGSKTGRELILDVHRAPAVLGEFAAYTGRPHLMSAVALEPCAVALVPRTILRTMIDGNPRRATQLLEMLQERYEVLSAHIEDLTGGSVEHRLACLFLRWRAWERPTADGERVLPLALTRRELAELVATRTETLVRVLTRWKALGAIQTRREGFVVKAWEPLERFALGDGETFGHGREGIVHQLAPPRTAHQPTRARSGC